ncbi:acyl-CoA thioesterase [Pikeienuella piscinae]|uniref:Acyl-CoA thioesterase n=1 Tax=Pikeienuella piscinae TaxID=2748098 RepID=A0A7M3T645_9RHOB|nr:acyl-CoA thioesterase [Pikeienuella piscinae]QIE57476.1 acyl-CoA thioesterase [Pikeienuella piscinae]
MAFTHHLKVLFQHCDPAGIVFYPRYFEMANEAVEAWFADRLATPFERLHGTMGLAIPTVALQVEFVAPSRHGDRLTFRLQPDRIGRSSLALGTLAMAEDGEERMKMRSTLVLTERAGGGARPWPDELRARLNTELKEEETR